MILLRFLLYIKLFCPAVDERLGRRTFQKAVESAHPHFLRLCLFAFIILQRRLNRFLGEDGAVHFVGGQAVKGFRYRFVGELHGVLYALTLDKLRRHRAGRYRAGAAEGFEFYVGDDIVVDFQIHFHDVAALGVADFTHAVRVLDHAEVARL